MTNRLFLTFVAVLTGIGGFPGILFGQEKDPTMETVAEEQRPPIIPTSAFADSNFLAGAKLSPDGGKIATRVTIKGTLWLVVLDSATLNPMSKTSIGGKTELEWFQWAGNDKLLFSISVGGSFRGEDVRWTRLFVHELTTDMTSYIGRK